MIIVLGLQVTIIEIKRALEQVVNKKSNFVRDPK